MSEEEPNESAPRVVVHLLALDNPLVARRRKTINKSIKNRTRAMKTRKIHLTHRLPENTMLPENVLALTKQIALKLQ